MKSMKPTVSSNWLYKNLSDPNLIVLDASIKKVTPNTVSPLSEICIIGARFFDLKHNFSNKNHTINTMLPTPAQFTTECQTLGINKKSKIVVYDNLGVYSSPRVWWMFKSMGFNNISVLDGGLPQWEKLNYPTEKIQKTHLDKGNFSATIKSELIKEQIDILKNIHSKNHILIDARSYDRFTGKNPEPRKGLNSGHIPNSINIPFSTMLKNGKYLSKSKLKKLFSSYNLSDKPLIFSCGSGVTACIVLLASELVHNNKNSLYDGSWSEWGSLNHLPISNAK